MSFDPQPEGAFCREGCGGLAKTPLVLRVSERCSAGGWGICADLGQEEIGSRKKGKEKGKEKEKERERKKERRSFQEREGPPAIEWEGLRGG